MKTNLLALSVLALTVLTPTAFANGRMRAVLDLVENNCPIHLESARPISRRGGLESFAETFTIKNGRLTLRVTDPNDEATMQRAIAIYTDPKVMAMSGDYLDERTVRQIQRMGVASPDQLQGHSMVNLAISTRDSATGAETIIGFAQLARTDVSAARMKGLVTDPERWFEISYHLHPDYWGKGYAGEIATTLVQEAMKNRNAEGVYAQTKLENDGSGAVLKKAGLVEIERTKYPRVGGVDGTVHYSITRDQFLNPPLKNGINIRRVEKDGQEMIALIIIGQVARWTVVKIDENTNSSNAPSPSRGDKFVQLTVKNGAKRETHGSYVTAPRTNPFGGGIYTSVLEIDRAISDSMEDGTLDQRMLEIVFEQRWGTQDLRGNLFKRMAARVPANFATLTVFEKKRVYEAMAAEVARTPTQFGLPFKLVIITPAGLDFLTREQVVDKAS